MYTPAINQFITFSFACSSALCPPTAFLHEYINTCVREFELEFERTLSKYALIFILSRRFRRSRFHPKSSPCSFSFNSFKLNLIRLTKLAETNKLNVCGCIVKQTENNNQRNCAIRNYFQQPKQQTIIYAYEMCCVYIKINFHQYAPAIQVPFRKLWALLWAFAKWEYRRHFHRSMAMQSELK